jgi:hypothetical protein
MKRIYAYKGFEVAVELEPVWETAGSVTLRHHAASLQSCIFVWRALLAPRLDQYA